MFILIQFVFFLIHYIDKYICQHIISSFINIMTMKKFVFLFFYKSIWHALNIIITIHIEFNFFICYKNTDQRVETGKKSWELWENSMFRLMKALKQEYSKGQNKRFFSICWVYINTKKKIQPFIWKPHIFFFQLSLLSDLG